MTTKTRTRKALKPTYRPEIKVVDAAAGTYTVSSEKYTYILYEVNVLSQTCTCEAAVKWGRVACKHRALCAEVHAKAHSCVRTGATWQTCPKCGARYYGVPSNDWCKCSPATTPPEEKYGKAAGLMEVFGL